MAQRTILEDDLDGSMDEIKNLAYDGATIDGAHHKQYYLVEICKRLGVNTSDLDEGIPF